MKLKVGKKTGLKYFGYVDIKQWHPCYDPVKYIREDWKGTAIDILKLQDIPPQDRLWCVLRAEVVSERVMRLFAVWCCRQTLTFVKNPDPRSVQCADIAEKFADGEATQEELSAARAPARAAARAAVRAAYAAYAAYSASAYSAAYAAYSAARAAQISKLIEVITEEAKQRKRNKQ